MRVDVTRCLGSIVEGNRRWLERLTLTQYALVTGVGNFVAFALVLAFVWWSGLPWYGPHRLDVLLTLATIFTVLRTTWRTWQRRKALRQNKDETSSLGN